MRKIFLTIPLLLLVGCNDTYTILYNVSYHFNRETMRYDIYSDTTDKVYYANVQHVYIIDLDSPFVEGIGKVYNEYYVSSKTLYVYVEL